MSSDEEERSRNRAQHWAAIEEAVQRIRAEDARDGIDQGISVDDLVARVGDPKFDHRTATVYLESLKRDGNAHRQGGRWHLEAPADWGIDQV
jgi:hypothetical protein